MIEKYNAKKKLPPKDPKDMDSCLVAIQDERGYMAAGVYCYEEEIEGWYCMTGECSYIDTDAIALWWYLPDHFWVNNPNVEYE